MSKLNFLSSNANGLRSSEKRIKVFEHLREKISGNGIIFHTRTHSSKDTFTEWKDDFAEEIFFSHRLTNSSSVMIAYLGNSTFNANKISKDNDNRILTIDVEIEHHAFVLINLYTLTLKLNNYKLFPGLTSYLNIFSILYTKY